MNYKPTPEAAEVIRIITDEKTSFEDSTVWATDKASYKMKDVIQAARKNYLGKYDQENDPNTDKKKIFVPFTEDMVETIVKNIDLDSVDINIRATNSNGRKSAAILEYLVSFFMRKNYFGEILNEMLRIFCIDGTVISKVMKNYDKKINRQAVKTKIVDATNFFIDPTENDIQSAGAVIERNVLRLSEINDYPWENKEYVKGFTDIAKLSHLSLNAGTTGEVPMVEVYERWGDLPLFCFTGKEKDKNTWVPAMAIVSNIGTSPVVHKIERNEKGIKPYEECRYKKIFGRWHGRGIGEMLKDLQSYINETVNLRLNKARISQIGLFKYRKGSGITQQMLQSLISGGSIPVTRMDDIQELAVSDVKASSYQDEQQTYMWGQRQIGAFEVGRGEALPSSMPATTAVIQERGMKSGTILLQENLGMFLSRMFERHIIPLIIETMPVEEVVSIVGSPKDLKELDEGYINSQVKDVIISSLAKGKGIPPADFLRHFGDITKETITEFEDVRYVNIKRDLLKKWQYEVTVEVTGESFNKAVMAQQLNEVLMNYSQIPGVNIDVDEVFKEVLNLMGLNGSRFIKASEEAQSIAPVQEASRPGMRPETEAVGEAATGERLGRGLLPTL
jgi:hypothetical protein